MMPEPADDDSDKGGPGKCGPLFCQYWKDKGKNPLEMIPDVDVKFKVYRVSDFDPLAGTFFIDFMLMLDWCDPSLGLSDGKKKPDFANHFWPKAELMGQTPGDAGDLDFADDGFAPKYKPDKDKKTKQPAAKYSSKFDMNELCHHRAAITMKVRRTLFARLDFHEFPFDRQFLELSIKLLSVRVPGTRNGARPQACHPIRWRGKSFRKENGHEILSTADCLAEFDILRLASKAFSSKHGSIDRINMNDEEKAALDKDIADKTYYQDQYTMQMCLARESWSVIWNMCFSLFVIDVMVFTGHGMELGGLGDRLGVNLTLLLTAMAFKWVLNEGTPNVPYLTLMEVYVICSFAALFFQGVAFWFIADAYNYRCGEDEDDAFYKDWITGVEKAFDNSTDSKAVLALSCSTVHVADRVVLFLEVAVFMLKNLWFVYKACKNSHKHIKHETGFYDLSRLKEYRGEHLEFEGDETQLVAAERERKTISVVTEGKQGTSAYISRD
jgi:hypothetical protein